MNSQLKLSSFLDKKKSDSDYLVEFICNAKVDKPCILLDRVDNNYNYSLSK